MTSKERQRFGLLQDKKQKNTLSDAEQTEWEQFVQHIEAAEAAYLRPATERVRQETTQFDAQNLALKNLIRRKERLVRRLERVLVLSNSEREAINAELAQILATPAM